MDSGLRRAVALGLALVAVAACSGHGAKKEAASALQEYRAAYEAADLERLQRVWRMNPEERDELARRLAAAPPSRVHVEPRDVIVDGDLALIEFEQVVERSGRTPVRTRLNAALSYDDQEWSILVLSPVETMAANLGAQKRGGRAPPPANSALSAHRPSRPSAPAPEILPTPSTAPRSRLWADFDPFGIASARSSLARLEADLVRRRSGEWVMVSLLPLDQAGEPATATNLGTHPSVRELLEAYESAFEARNVDRLERVWVMNPFERDRVRRLFHHIGEIKLSIAGARVWIDGDRGGVQFDQRFDLPRRPHVNRLMNRAFHRALAARDHHGGWALEDVTTVE